MNDFNQFLINWGDCDTNAANIVQRLSFSLFLMDLHLIEWVLWHSSVTISSLLSFWVSRMGLTMSQYGTRLLVRIFFLWGMLNDGKDEFSKWPLVDLERCQLAMVAETGGSWRWFVECLWVLTGSAWSSGLPVSLNESAWEFMVCDVKCLIVYMYINSG